MTAIYRAPMPTRHGLTHDLVGIGDVEQRRVERFAAVPEGSFVWTRDPDGQYWLGRITGPCRSGTFPDGLRHVRSTDWLDVPVPLEAVPSGVLATFARGGRNFQRTHDAAAEQATAALWAQWSL